MKLTKQWLKNKNACKEGVEWFDKQKNHDDLFLLNELIKENKLDWANWFIAHRLQRLKTIQYAIYAAKQVLPIFEEKYPDDKRPRKAIEAATKYIKNPTKKNKEKAYVAANEAYEAANEVYAAYAAAYAAAWAAARVVARAVADATYAAADAVYVATRAVYAAKKQTKIKILKYGIKLLENELPF